MGTKILDLNGGVALAPASIAVGDMIPIVDVSDTTEHASGTTKPTDLGALIASLPSATQYTLGSGSTNITQAAHATRPGIVNQAGATGGVFAATATSGAVAGAFFYLRNTGAGTFTASGTITAAAGFKLTAGPGEVFTADYDSVDDAWYSTTPAGQGQRLIFWSSSAVQVTAPASDTSEQTLATITLPILEANDRCEIDCKFAQPSGTANTTYTVKLDGSEVLSIQPGGSGPPAYRVSTQFQNRNSVSSQLCGNAAMISGFGSSSLAWVTRTVDTSTAKDLTIRITKATGSDTVRLESYDVKVYR